MVFFSVICVGAGTFVPAVQGEGVCAASFVEVIYLPTISSAFLCALDTSFGV